MELKLSCFKCGSTDLKTVCGNYYRIENEFYILHEDKKKSVVLCNKCGLEDYVENLVIKLAEKEG